MRKPKYSLRFVLLAMATASLVLGITVNWRGLSIALLPLSPGEFVWTASLPEVRPKSVQVSVLYAEDIYAKIEIPDALDVIHVGEIRKGTTDPFELARPRLISKNRHVELCFFCSGKNVVVEDAESNATIAVFKLSGNVSDILLPQLRKGKTYIGLNTQAQERVATLNLQEGQPVPVYVNFERRTDWPQHSSNISN
jgi:hypothetical protein